MGYVGKLMALPALQVRTEFDAKTPNMLFRQGAQDQIASNERGYLKNIGNEISQNGYLAGADEAFRSGHVKAGLDLQNMDARKRDKMMDAMLKGAERASTPAMWLAYINTLKKTFGPDEVKGWEDFNSRPRAMTMFQELKLAQQKDRDDRPLSKEGKIQSDVQKGHLTPSQGQGAMKAPSGTDKVMNRIIARDELKTLQGYRKSADSARQLLGDVAQMRVLRKQKDFEGPFVGRALGAVGYGQALQSKATEIQLSFTERTKGAISDKEMGLFASATPGISMLDKEADKVLAGMEAGALRVRERQKFYSAWRSKHKTLDGSDDAWDSYVDENPVISTAKDGSLVVNKANIRNWKKYVGSNADFTLVKPEAPSQPARVFDTTNVPAPNMREMGDVINLPDGRTGTWTGAGWEVVE